MDIYAPCALGSTVNDENLSRLKCGIIAGAANNQLKDETIHGQELLNKKIIYAPDYVINAGGVINCFSEVKGLSSDWSNSKTKEIYDTIFNIVKRSKDEGLSTHTIANKMAEERIESIGKVKLPM